MISDMKDMASALIGIGGAENTRLGRETQIKALKKLLKQEIEAI